ILQILLKSTDNELRKQSESQLATYLQQDPNSYFTQLVSEFINQQNEPIFRQFACTILNQAILKNIDSKQYAWECLDQNLRENIKSTLLSNMMTNIQLIQKSCANAISSICVVEIPQKQWQNLISDLSSSTQPNVDIQIKKAAIMTLGQICDKLKQHRFSLEPQQKEQILTAILLGLSPEEQDVDIKTNSIIALGDAIEFMEELFQQKMVLEFSTQQLISCITNPLDVETLKLALQRTTDYVKTLHKYIGQYIVNLYNATENFIAHEDPEIACPAIEIWTTIASEYLERRKQNLDKNRINNVQQDNPNHIMQVQENLIRALLQNLLKNDTQQSTFESEIQECAQKSLCSIVEAVGDIVIPTFTIFISNTISNQEWQHRQAAAQSFGTLMEGISKVQISQLIQNGISEFVKMLQDSTQFVRESCSKLLSKIAEFHPECLFTNQNSNQDFQLILQSLTQSHNISKNISWLFCFLGENLEQYPNNSVIHKNVDIIIDSLIKNGIRGDLQQTDYSLIDVSFMGVMNYVHFSKQPQIAQKYLDFFIAQFDNSNSINDGRKSQIQSGILSAMHSCLLGLDEYFNKNQSKDVYNLIVNHFKRNADVDTDGMYVISALATVSGEDFCQYLDNFWPFINHSLSNKQQDLELFKTTLGTIGDIARACEAGFKEKLNILEPLMLGLEQTNFDREVKLQIFNCIGDIFLASKLNCLPYLDKMMRIFEFGFVGALEMQYSTDLDIIDYSEQLKDKIIDAYTCVMHGINDAQPNRYFLQHIPKLVEFIYKTCEQQYHPTVEYVKNCISLLMDIGNFYKKEAKQYIKNNQTISIINILKQFDQSPETKENLAYAERILKEMD
ncbi:importin beta, putative, partial [Ichthyophthirius multifiliis]